MAEQARHLQGRRLGASVALALLAGACIGRREPLPEPQQPPQEPQEEQAEPDPTSTLPPDADRNRVAVLVPLSGANAGVGTSIANAANLALLDTGGTAIRITVYDTAKGAAAAANAALADGNRLFLGPLMAEDVRAVAPIARGRGVPVIALSNDASVAGRGTYIMGFTPDQSIARVVDYAHDKGAARFAAIVPEGVYGRRAGQALIDAVSRVGGRLVALEGFSRAPGAVGAAVRELGAKGGYDAVLIADNAAVAAAAAPLLRRGASGTAQILGTELWSTDRTLGKTSALRGALFAGVPDARFDQLVTRYRARYRKTPYRLASLGYDGVLLAVRMSRNWPVRARFPERRLTDADGFSGVDGAFRFRRDGTAERRMAVHSVGISGATIVSPAATGFGG